MLLVEDDPLFGPHFRDRLVKEGYVVTLVQTCADADKAIKAQPGITVLDLSLPDGRADQRIAAWRAGGYSQPILILSGVLDEVVKVGALDAGADDYVTKPPVVSEVLARLRALQRRPTQLTGERLQYADIVLDVHGGIATRGGQVLHLRRREFDLLELFLLQAERLVRRSRIEEVLGISSREASNVVDVHVAALRKALHSAGTFPVLHTVKGFGYRLGMDPPASRKEKPE